MENRKRLFVVTVEALRQQQGETDPSFDEDEPEAVKGLHDEDLDQEKREQNDGGFGTLYRIDAALSVVKTFNQSEDSFHIDLHGVRFRLMTTSLENQLLLTLQRDGSALLEQPAEFVDDIKTQIKRRKVDIRTLEKHKREILAEWKKTGANMGSDAVQAFMIYSLMEENHKKTIEELQEESVDLEWVTWEEQTIALTSGTPTTIPGNDGLFLFLATANSIEHAHWNPLRRQRKYLRTPGVHSSSSFRTNRRMPPILQY